MMGAFGAVPAVLGAWMRSFVHPVLGLAVALALGAGISRAQQDDERTFRVAPQSAAGALERFSEQSGISFLYSTDSLAGVISPGVSGTMSTGEALDAIFADTGLRYAFTGDTTISVSQSPGASAPDADTGEVFIPPIIVSARRTEEFLSDVPGSVSVLTDTELQRSNIVDFDSALLRIPNVNFSDNSKPTDLRLTIRGIGELAGGTTSGPTNGVFVDGILINPTGTQTGLNGTLFDLERVETAFGPQGTAFGRGTIGGAINLVTKKPTDEYTATFEGEVGSFPDGEGRLVLNAPLLDDGLLSARLVAFGGHSDGYVDFSNITDPDSNTETNAGFRLSLRSRPVDRLTLDASVSFERTEFDADNTASLASFDAGDPTSDIDFVGDPQLDRLFGTFQGTYEFDAGTLISSTSYRQNENNFDLDLDETELALATLRGQNTERSFTQEFRFESEEVDLDDGYGTVSFNAGAIVNYAEFDLFNVNTPGDDTVSLLLPFVPPAVIGGLAGLPASALPPPGVPFTLDTLPAGAVGDVRNPSTREVFHLGAYGDIRWRPVEPLEVAVGARFHRDRVGISTETFATGLSSLAASSLPLQKETRIFTAVTPNASLIYDWTDSFSTYASFSTGYRPGGFGANIFGLRAFDEEKARSYEAGFKASLLDDRLYISGSGYFLDYDDVQVTTNSLINGIQVISIDNAAKVRSVGSEVVISAVPFPGLQIDAQMGLNFSRFTDFTTSPFGDLSGSRLPSAPVHTVSFSADYEHPEPLFRNVFGFVRAEDSYRSSFRGSANPASQDLDGYTIVNFRAGLRSDNFEISAFVENAFNKSYATAISTQTVPGIADPVTNVSLGDTRRFGVVARIDF